MTAPEVTGGMNREGISPVSRCMRGHLLNDKTVRLVRAKSGAIYRLCRECALGHQRRYYKENIGRNRAISLAYYRANADRLNAHNKEWTREHPEQKRRQMRKSKRRRNGFAGDLFSVRLAEQGNKCAICGVGLVEKGSVRYRAAGDHCHLTNTARGILCNGCNLILGHAHDNAEILRNAVAYLGKWATVQSGGE